jgi:multidrug efflux pump subunit AcrA (membrane-fusion protein)
MNASNPNAPRSRDRRALLRVGAVAAVALVALVALWAIAGRQAEEVHPDGEHTLAGVPATGGLAAFDRDGDGFVYQCAMHPDVVRDEPGNCPICGMRLTRRAAGAPSDAAGASAGVVEIDPVTLQNLGVATAPVMVDVLEREVRTTGTFEASDAAREAVSLRIGGWVEQLYVNVEGQRVRRGQPLLRIYSPDLVATQEEYLLALRNREILGGEGGSDRLIQAAARRLELFGVSAAQIRELQRAGRVQTTLTLYAPASGTVTRKMVVEGMQAAPGQTLMEIVDLSQLWLQVAVPEHDLGWVRPGVRAAIEVPSFPDRPLTGRVSYIYDEMALDTRTGRARVVVPNPGGLLQTGMYATVTLYGAPSEPHPLVPSDAVIRTGEDAVVIVALGGGRFRPQRVTLGEEAGAMVQVLDGLDGTEEIVTRAQFLIDSEARLSGALAGLGTGAAPDDVRDGAATPMPPSHNH